MYKNVKLKHIFCLIFDTNDVMKCFYIMAIDQYFFHAC